MKQTEIGLLPYDWEVYKIEDLTPKNVKYTIVDGPFGSNLKTIHYRKKGIPIITSGYVTDGKFYAEEYLYVDNEKFQQEKRSSVQAGDIIMAKIGERCGASAILPLNHTESILSGNALKIKIDKERFSSNLIAQILYNDYLRGNLNQLRTVGAQPAISMANLKIYKIPLPLLPEQEAIAEVLSDTDRLIESLEKLIAKKRLIKLGAMQELLTPKEGWKERTLGELGEVKMCKRIFQYETSEFGDVPFFKIGTFGKTPDAFISKSHYEDFKSRFSFPKKGEILISAAGTIGRTVVYDGEESYFQDSNIVWINNQEEIVSNALLKYILEGIKYNTEGGTIQRLYNSILKNTSFHCPPFTQQTGIVVILSEIDTELDVLEIQLAKARQIKQGMMQDLLTGRIRLI